MIARGMPNHARVLATAFTLLLGILVSPAYAVPIAHPIRIDSAISFAPPDSSFSPFIGVLSLAYVESGVTRTLEVTPVLGLNEPGSFGSLYEFTGGQFEFLGTLEFDLVGTAGDAPAFAFPSGLGVPLSAPRDPPRIPIPIPTVPLQIFAMQAPIYAFQSPGMEVGTWSVTISAVAEPSSYFWLFAGLGLLALAWGKRRQGDTSSPQAVV